MIQYSNQKRFERLPFDTYLKLPGLSHSFLKTEKNGVSPFMEITEKMKLGSMVDAILTEPHKVDVTDPNFAKGKRIASAINEQFGSLIKTFIPQLSYTGAASFEGFTIEVCGRLDWLLPGHAVVDLKVTAAKDIQPIIQHFGYNNQMFNYCKLAGVKVAYIISYSTALNKCLPVVKIDCSSDRNAFWEEKILKFGTCLSAS